LQAKRIVLPRPCFTADIQDILVELACVKALLREAGVLYCNIITEASTEQFVVKKCVFMLVNIEFNFVCDLKIISLDKGAPTTD
jgi:hypothetical protein